MTPPPASPSIPAALGRRAFTIMELLVVITVVALLLSILLPALGGARAAGRQAACQSNQRQMLLGWMLYADAHQGFAMPLADVSGQPVYWWGAVAGNTIDQTRGYLTTYLDAPLGERGVFECAAQPWGTYRPQPASVSPGLPTSTYGYNGYYLCPPATPGWSLQIGGQRWKRLSDLDRPTELFVFADTLLPGTPPRNCALLDPPMLFGAGCSWSTNLSPTTSFRHRGQTVTARGDGSVRAVASKPEWILALPLNVGSVGSENGPHYVPDWQRWR